MLKYIIFILIMIKTVYISSDTNDIEIDQRKKWATFWAEDMKIELALVKAIAKQESREGLYLKRYEKHLKKADWYLSLLTEEEKKNPYSYYSMGDMQLLFGIAKEMGFIGTPHELLNPMVNYQYGIRYLKYLCLCREGMDIKDVISSYNQGLVKNKNGRYYLSKFVDENNNGIKEIWEKFRNWRYVENVMKYYHQFGGKIK